MSAAHPRPEAPLRPEGLATLALRKLNRQPAGVLALHWTTCRLRHYHGVRTLAKPSLVRICSGVSSQPRPFVGTRGIVYFIPSRVNKKSCNFNVYN